jgi:hypothetical protein
LLLRGKLRKRSRFLELVRLSPIPVNDRKGHYLAGFYKGLRFLSALMALQRAYNTEKQSSSLALKLGYSPYVINKAAKSPRFYL